MNIKGQNSRKSPQKRSAGGVELRDSFVYCGAFGAPGAESARGTASQLMVAKVDIRLNSSHYLHLTNQGDLGKLEILVHQLSQTEMTLTIDLYQ